MSQLQDQLQILREAQGDPAALVLATIDLAHAELPALKRDFLKRALEAAAVPHWVDERILAGLLETSLDESGLLLAQLRSLRVIEAFPARGIGAVNVHEASRHALRAALRQKKPELLLYLSRRARTTLLDVPQTAYRIEALYHLFSIDQNEAVNEWERITRFQADPQERAAIAVALGELLNEGILGPGAHAAALLARLSVRYNRGERTALEAQAREAMLLAEKAVRPSLQADASCLLGEALLAGGKDQEAEAAFRDQLRIFAQLSQESPEHEGWLRELAVAHSKLGELMFTRGTFPQALELMRRSLSLCQSRATQTADPLDAQRNVAAAHSRVAAFLAAMGSPGEALRDAHAALEIFEKLATQHQENLDQQRDLAVAYETVAGILNDQGQHNEALVFHQKDVAISERLVEADPDNVEFRRDLGCAYSWVGFALQKLTRVEEALEAYRKNTLLAEHLANDDPNSAVLQRDLGIAERNVAGALRKLAKHTEAIVHLQRAESHLRQAVQMSPSRVMWQEELESTRKMVASAKSDKSLPA